MAGSILVTLLMETKAAATHMATVTPQHPDAQLPRQNDVCSALAALVHHEDAEGNAQGVTDDRRNDRLLHDDLVDVARSWRPWP